MLGRFANILVLCLWVLKSLGQSSSTCLPSFEGYSLDELKQHFYQKDLRPKKIQEIIACGLHKSRIAKDTTSEVFFLNELANSSLKADEYRQTDSILKLVLNISASISNLRIKAKSLNIYGSLKLKLGEVDSAIFYYQSSLDLRLPIHDKEYFFAQNGISNSYQRDGKYRKSLEILEIMLKEQKDSTNFHGIILNKAIALHNLGHPDQAIRLFLTAHNYFSRQNELRYVLLAKHHIAYLLKRIEIYEYSLHYFQQVEAYLASHPNLIQEAHLNKNIGELYYKLEKPLKGKSRLLKAIKISEEIKGEILGYCYLGMAENLLSQDELDGAKNFIGKAEKEFASTGLKKGLFELYLTKSNYALANNDLNRANVNLSKTRSFMEELDLPNEIIKYEELKYRILVKEEKLKKAISQRKKLDSLKQEYFGSEELINIAKAIIMNEKVSSEEATSESNNQSYGFLKTFLVVSALILIYFIYKRNAKQDEALEKREVKPYISDNDEIDGLVSRLKRYLDEEKNYRKQELSLKLMADELNTSEKKLSFIFNAKLNSTFYDYIYNLRLIDFEEMIRNGYLESYSIIGMANKCGFKSKSVFYREFKKKFNCTPKQFLSNL